MGKLLEFKPVKQTSVADNRPSGEFGDRTQRIRLSLEKINSLMAELKRNNQTK